MQRAKILWGEGLFLRPQHFQQQDAYAEALSRHALMTAQPFAWGVKDIELDIEALKTGTLRFNRIDVVLCDGTPFTAPDIDQLPPPVALDALVTDQGGTTFYLAIHQLKNHGGNCVESANDGNHVRFLIEPKDTADLFTDAADAQITYLSKLACLKAASEPRDQYITLPLLHVRRTSSDGFERDPAFLPPAISLRSAPLLYLMLRRQVDAQGGRGDQLLVDQPLDHQLHRTLEALSLLQLDEIDIEHHHHEQEQHRHRADIDDDQDHRQEFGAHEHEQPRRVEKGEDEEEHRMHRIARGDDHERGGNGQAREQVEEGSRQDHDLNEPPLWSQPCPLIGTAHRARCSAPVRAPTGRRY